MKIRLIKEALKKNQECVFETTFGNSMWPLVSKNDKIFIINRPFKDLKKGDIILFYHNCFILHRIIENLNGKLITKGDNNRYKDNFLINKEDYIGLLNKIEKKRFNFTFNKNFIKAYKYFLPFRRLFIFPLRFINYIKKD